MAFPAVKNLVLYLVGFEYGRIQLELWKSRDSGGPSSAVTWPAEPSTAVRLATMRQCHHLKQLLVVLSTS